MFTEKLQIMNYAGVSPGMMSSGLNQIIQRSSLGNAVGGSSIRGTSCLSYP